MLYNLLFITTAFAQETTQVPVEEGEERAISILELMTSGGIGGQIIMISLLILSIIAVYLFIERYMTIIKASKVDPQFMSGLKDNVLKGDLDSARALCNSHQSPVS